MEQLEPSLISIHVVGMFPNDNGPIFDPSVHHGFDPPIVIAVMYDLKKMTRFGIGIFSKHNQSLQHYQPPSVPLGSMWTPGLYFLSYFMISQLLFSLFLDSCHLHKCHHKDHSLFDLVQPYYLYIQFSIGLHMDPKPTEYRTQDYRCRVNVPKCYSIKVFIIIYFLLLYE